MLIVGNVDVGVLDGADSILTSFGGKSDFDKFSPTNCDSLVGIFVNRDGLRAITTHLALIL